MAPKTKKTLEPVIEVEELDPVEPEPVAKSFINIINDADEMITIKRSQLYAVLSMVTFVAGIVLGYLVWGVNVLSQFGIDMNPGAQAAVAEAAATGEPQYTRYDIPTKGFYTLGPADAPITIVEFSDYQCPFCRRWHAEVYENLLASYPGKIKFVYRNLPLTTIHPDAQGAAEAAMCAGEQNVYWQYHDKLFTSEILGNGAYTQYAQELNLDMTAFNNCISTEKYKDAIQADSDFALNMGVRSTPTFFINGLAVVGAQPIEVFKDLIDKELAGEIPTN